VTNESAGQTEDFVEDTGAKYAYAYDKGGKLKRWFGVSGIPHAILVDPTGMVVWRGHPASLKGADIEPALKGSLATPLYAFGKEAKGVKKALAKGKWAKAVAEADALGEAGAGLQKSLADLIDMRAAVLDTAWEAGDYHLAQRMAESNAKQFADLPQAETAEQILTDLKKDKDKQKVLKAQLQIQKLLEEPPRKDKDFEKLYKKLEKIAEKNAGTYAADEAIAARTSMRKLQVDMNKR
jgi:hypothetical protein